jgi:hypothetical protein
MDALGTIVKAGQFINRVIEKNRQKTENQWERKCLAEATEFGTALVVALLARELGRHPYDDEVQEHLRRLTEGGAFAARMHRFIPELFKTTSAEKRKRLAAALIGGPAVVKSADEQDRLDILVEGLLDEEVHLLGRMVHLRSGPEGITRNNVDLTVALVDHGDASFLLAAGFKFARHPISLDPREMDGPVSPMALINLEMSGCIRLHRRAAEATVQGDEENVYQAHGVEITPVGLFLIDKLKQLEIAMAEAQPPR